MELVDTGGSVQEVTMVIQERNYDGEDPDDEG